MQNMISQKGRVPKEVKLQFIENCIEAGFDFGGVVSDTSITGAVEFTLIALDENASGMEIKGRKSQFGLYEISNGKSKKGCWYNFEQAVFSHGPSGVEFTVEYSFDNTEELRSYLTSKGYLSSNGTNYVSDKFNAEITFNEHSKKEVEVTINGRTFRKVNVQQIFIKDSGECMLTSFDRIA